MFCYSVQEKLTDDTEKSPCSFRTSWFQLKHERAFLAFSGSGTICPSEITINKISAPAVLRLTSLGQNAGISSFVAIVLLCSKPAPNGHLILQENPFFITIDQNQGDLTSVAFRLMYILIYCQQIMRSCTPRDTLKT